MPTCSTTEMTTESDYDSGDDSDTESKIDYKPLKSKRLTHKHDHPTRHFHDPKSHTIRPQKQSQLKKDHKTSIPSTQSTKQKEVHKDQDIEDLIAQISKLSVDDSKYAKLFYHAIKLDRHILQIFPKPILGNYTRPKVEAQKPLPTAQREDRNSSHTYRDKPSNPTYLSGVCFGCNSHAHPLSRCPIIGDLISREDLTKIRGMIALPSGEIIRRNPTESFAEAFHRIKQEMLRSKSNFILTNDVHYCRGFTYYIIPDRDTQEPVDIDNDEDYYDNVLSDYYEYDNEDNNLSDYEDEHQELAEVWIYAAEHQQKDTRSFWHQVMDGVYIPSWKRSGNEFQTSEINSVHNKPRYVPKGKNELQKENIPPPREFWVWSTTDPPIQQADCMILRQGEWPLESKNEMVTRQNVKTVDVPMKVPADAWPRQPRTYLTTSATPQSREQGARGSRDVEMRDETKEGRTGKKEERRKK